MCDEIIDGEAKLYDKETKTVKTNFNKKMQSVKQKISVLLAFSLITITLLIAVNIYCYLIKYKAKKNNIYCHITSQITN